MMGRGLLVVTLLSSCVLSLPATPSPLENEDVKVMKCIVEALADVLSRPRPVPVSHECLVLLKTDDRLVSILRHHNFLKELQEIAIQGGHKRAQLQGDADKPEPTRKTPQAEDEVADRSMLEALGGPGERSILSQKRTGNRGREEEKGDDPRRDDAGEMQEKRRNDENRGSHVPEDEGKAEKSEGGEHEEEKPLMEDKKGADERRDGPKSKGKMLGEGGDEERDKRFFPTQGVDEDDEGQRKRESSKPWSKRGKLWQMKKRKEEQQQVNREQEVPHHSKEAPEEEEEAGMKKWNKQRTPEEKELQMIARRGPKERREPKKRRGSEEKKGSEEEEGSAGSKSEEPEIESLAAIESELENVAQKLHDMRRG